MKKSPLYIIAILLCALSFGFISTGIIMQTKKSNLQDTLPTMNASIKKTIKLEEEIDPENLKVVELMTLIQGKEQIVKHNYKPEYMDSFYYKTTTETKIKDIDNDILLKMLWLNLKDSKGKTDIEGGFTVSVDEFKNMYNKLFGDSIEFSKSTTSTTADACLKVNYNTKNDNYEFFNNCSESSKTEIIPAIIKAVRSDKEIRIYQKVAIINNNNLYKDLDLRARITNKFEENRVKEYPLNTYIFTFKANSKGEYYFYKVSKQ